MTAIQAYEQETLKLDRAQQVPVKFRIFNTDIKFQVILNLDLKVLLGQCRDYPW